jgi:Family of unknown function (DUF5995)
VTENLRDVLAAKPATSIAAVIARMKQLVAALPPHDGVRTFAALYLAVTEAVDESAKDGAFEDASFARRLDVVFANHFFSALRNALLRAGPVPKSWSPLFEARGRRGVLPLQFALAGMNAHINRDLPIALEATCQARKVAPEQGTPQQRDFRRVNPLLERVEGRVKEELLTAALAQVDLALGNVDDVIAMWVERARETAWANAETLWAIRQLPRVRAEFLLAQDRLVGFAGRGLLRPVALH